MTLRVGRGRVNDSCHVCASSQCPSVVCSNGWNPMGCRNLESRHDFTGAHDVWRCFKPLDFVVAYFWTFGFSLQLQPRWAWAVKFFWVRSLLICASDIQVVVTHWHFFFPMTSGIVREGDGSKWGGNWLPANWDHDIWVARLRLNPELQSWIAIEAQSCGPLTDHLVSNSWATCLLPFGWTNLWSCGCPGYLGHP